MMMIACITINSANALRVKEMMPQRRAFWRDSLSMMCYAKHYFSFNLHCQFKCGRESSSSSTGRRPYARGILETRSPCKNREIGRDRLEKSVTRHITDNYFFDELGTKLRAFDANAWSVGQTSLFSSRVM